MSKKLVSFISGLGLGSLVTFGVINKLKNKVTGWTFQDPSEFIGDYDGLEEINEADEDSITLREINEASDTKTSNRILIDALDGISVSGKDATLVTVRVLGFERAKLVAMWGTKGEQGDTPTEFRRLVDLPSDHLISIRNNSKKVTPDELKIIQSIIEDRVAAGIIDEDVLNIALDSIASR